MPKYPFIPPAKKRRIPSTRPVTILDTPPADGGWEYRASYCGIPLQVFSQRPVNGNLLQAGDTIIARWVPGAEQLWFPSPERGQVLYFTPGGAGTQAAHGPGELWSYNGAAFVHRWTCPNPLEMITCLSWHADYLWIFTAEPTLAPGVPPVIRMYQYDVATDIATHLAAHDALLIAHWNIFDLSLPVLDTAEYIDGLLYILQTPGRVLRYNAATNTLTEVLPRPGVNEEVFGGIAVFDNPFITVLVASDGLNAWASLTGDLGSWLPIGDFSALFDVDRIVSLVTHSTGDIYCCVHRPLGMAWHTTCVLRLDLGGWAVEFDNLNPSYQGANACSIMRPSGDLISGMNGGDLAGDLSVAVEVPPWGFDWVGPTEPPEYVLGIEQNLVSRAGQVCALYQYNDAGVFGTAMFVRSTAGVWALARTWEPYWSFHVSEWEPKLYWSLLPMTLIRTALLPHEM